MIVSLGLHDQSQNSGVGSFLTAYQHTKGHFVRSVLDDIHKKLMCEIKAT